MHERDFINEWKTNFPQLERFGLYFSSSNSCAFRREYINDIEDLVGHILLKSHLILWYESYALQKDKDEKF
jgi:hypothetical protein